MGPRRNHRGRSGTPRTPTRPLLLVDIDANNVATVSPPSPDWVGTATLKFTAVEENAERLPSQESVTFTVENGGAGKSAVGRRRVYLSAAERTVDGRWVVPVWIDEMEGVVAGEVELILSGPVQGEIQTAELT
jgi:hypothetical protein